MHDSITICARSQVHTYYQELCIFESYRKHKTDLQPSKTRDFLDGENMSTTITNKHPTMYLYIYTREYKHHVQMARKERGYCWLVHFRVFETKQHPDTNDHASMLYTIDCSWNNLASSLAQTLPAPFTEYLNSILPGEESNERECDEQRYVNTLKCHRRVQFTRHTELHTSATKRQ